jgi:hypothetical protein
MPLEAELGGRNVSCAKVYPRLVFIDPKPMNLKNALGLGHPKMAGNPHQVSDQ